MNMLRILFGAIALSLLAGGAWAQALMTGSPMPHFTAPDQNNRPISLRDLQHGAASGEPKGGAARPVVLIFTASWCQPCQRDNGSLANLLSGWERDRVSVGFAQLLTMGPSRQPSGLRDAQAWAAKGPQNQPVLYESAQKALAGLAGASGFAVANYPTYVVLGADLRVRAIIPGPNLGALDQAVRAEAGQRKN